MKTYIQRFTVLSVLLVIGNLMAHAQPGAFSLVSPTNGAYVSATPYFDWGTSSGAVRYKLYLDGILKKDSISTSYYQITTAEALTEALHTWYVVADDGLGNTTQSTQTWSIIVDATPPNTFDLASPTDMQWTNQLRPTFQWSASNDAGVGLAKYQLWIDSIYLYKDNIPANSTSTTITSDLTNGDHKWFIKAIDSVGNVRKSNQTWTVRIDNLPPGGINKSIYFDGSNDYINVPNSTSLSVTNTITLEAWIYFQGGGTSNPRIISKEVSAFNASYILFTNGTGNNRTISFVVHTTTGYYTLSSHTSLNSYEWHHVAGVYDGSSVAMYIDGIFDNSATKSGSLINTSYSYINIGRDTRNADYFQGGIDEVRIWNIARSQSQIQNSMNIILGGEEPGLVGYWHFNEGSGGIAYDNSHNGNDGTLMNGAYFNNYTIPGTELGVLCDVRNPQYGQFLAGAMPRFAWGQAVDAGVGFQKFQIYLDGVLLHDDLADSTFTVVTPLSYGLHTWYVRGFDSLGNSQRSGASLFYIDTAPPNLFSLSSPPDSQIVSLPTPNFSWQATADSTGGSGLSKYQLWIDGVVNIDSIPTGTITTSPNSPLSESPHMWFVKAYDKVGNVRTSTQTRTVFVDFNPPTTFDLISPASNETVYVSKPVFVWHPSSDIGSGLVRYELHISGQSTLNLSPTDTSVQLAYSLPNGTYTWFVNAVDRAGKVRNSNQTDWKVVIDVQPPVAPSMQYPSNDAINLPTTLTLRWNASAGAETYRLQLSTDSLFGSFLINDSTLTDTTQQVGPLSNKMKYFWRVNAKNTGGTSPWSQVWNFTTIIAIPLPPTLVSPANSSTNQPTTLTLRWNTSPRAKTYELQVAFDLLFTSIVHIDTALVDTFRQIGSLLNDAAYYWRIRAKNEGGTSAYSSVQNFRTIVSPPTTPNLVFPINGSIDQPNIITMRWERAAGAIAYTLQFSLDSVFSSILWSDSAITDTSFRFGFGYDQTYYWHVRAKNVGGISDWSATWNFTTIVQLPTQITLLLPLNGATVNTDSVNCVWQKGTPAITAYWYERATDSLFTTNRVIDSSLIDSSYITHALVNGQTYWWRVKAKNVAGWGPFSEKRKFNAIIVAVNDEKGLPHKFSLGQNYPNPFNPSTTIKYALPQASHVSLSVFSTLGQRVALLMDGKQEVGYYEVNFDASGLTSGVYFYRLQAGEYIETKKLILMK